MYNMKVHFIAIGGAVMHNLAIALHKKGYIVTGSDDEILSRQSQDWHHTVCCSERWLFLKVLHQTSIPLYSDACQVR